MPELPEVETVRQGLVFQIINQTIADVAISLPKVFRGNKISLIGGKIVGVRRLSKLLLIDLDNKYSLAIHLKMTGRLIVDDIVSPQLRKYWEFDYESSKHTHVHIVFASGKSLLFHDVRQFGYIESIPTDIVNFLPYVKNLGKEFLSNLTKKDFQQVIASSKRMIKVVLLDQTKVAGVGNIYANEALWIAGIHPETPANKISTDKGHLLFAALERVMQEAIKNGGASSDDFRDVLGKPGQAQKNFMVYGRNGLSCARCTTKITKFFVSGRGTFICEVCQKSN
jgi:formamidopyrimidine-DNA glycosylase